MWTAVLLFFTCTSMLRTSHSLVVVVVPVPRWQQRRVSGWTLLSSSHGNEEHDTIRAGDTKDDTMTTHGDETNKQQEQQQEQEQEQQHRKELDASAIRYLGLGPNAIVREGAVLVAPPEEYNHYLMRSALFVYAMGLDDYNEQVIRCVVLDNPTPFTLGEMATGLNGMERDGSSSSSASSSPLLNNLIYRGGNLGGETAMMLHSRKELERDEIGTSGIYEGGLAQALSQVKTITEADADANEAQAPMVNDFKFFFNYCQFSPVELETMLDVIDPETGDAWISFEVPPALILEEWDKNEFWRYLRNDWKKRKAHSTPNMESQD
jgi:hypothetical protein